jgi:protein-L-isoaspartate(D-aspartate) O-methyltransferase
VLVGQLREGGRLVIPVGDTENQTLMHGKLENGKLKSRSLFNCRFVPLMGRYGWRQSGRKFQ